MPLFCIRSRGRLVCLEKNGSPGPYVRAEFRSEKDLAEYVSWSMLEDARRFKTDYPGGGVLVSLNDRLIGVYPSGVSPFGGALVAWFREPDGHVLSLTQFR